VRIGARLYEKMGDFSGKFGLSVVVLIAVNRKRVHE
jgi:hypothetical protein